MKNARLVKMKKFEISVGCLEVDVAKLVVTRTWDTNRVYIETISNPKHKAPDIQQLAGVCRKRGIASRRFPSACAATTPSSSSLVLTLRLRIQSSTAFAVIKRGWRLSMAAIRTGPHWVNPPDPPSRLTGITTCSCGTFMATKPLLRSYECLRTDFVSDLGPCMG